MAKWDELADRQTIERTIAALKANGIEAFFAENAEQAKRKVLELIPGGAEVMTMTSTTLDAIGLAKELDESGRFNSVRKKFAAMDRNKQGLEMRRLGAAQAFSVGSVHAVTEDGHILVASQSGSQIPSYSYGAGKAIWVVGAQKIVKNIEEGFRRVYEYCLPLENERAKKVYGTGSGVNKLLVINKEIVAGRLALVFVNEALGF